MDARHAFPSLPSGGRPTAREQEPMKLRLLLSSTLLVAFGLACAGSSDTPPTPPAVTPEPATTTTTATTTPTTSSTSTRSTGPQTTTVSKHGTSSSSSKSGSSSSSGKSSSGGKTNTVKKK